MRVGRCFYCPVNIRWTPPGSLLKLALPLLMLALAAARAQNIAPPPPGFIPATAPSAAAAPPTFQSPLLPSNFGNTPATVLPAQPSLPELPTGAPDDSPTASGAALTGAAGAPVNPEIGVARRFLYLFRFGARAVADDNIFLNPNRKEGDEFFVFSLGATLGLGDPTGAGNYLRLEYAPDASFYLAHSENDAVQHTLTINGLYQFSKLTVTGRFGLQILDGTDVTTANAVGGQSTQANLDVNGRSRVNIYSGQGNFHYAFSDKTSGDLGAQFTISNYETLLSSQNLSGDLFLNYAYSPKLTVGAGATLGITFADAPNPTQTYYQANLRANYEATGKISLSGTFGIEFRTSESSDSVGVGPVFNLNAIYLPFDGTSVSLSTSRQTTPSAVEGGQSYQTTDLSFSVRQRFFQRFFLGLTVGYQNSHYVSEVSRVEATRDDNYFYVQPSFDFVIHENISVGVSFLHRESQSTVPSAGFDDNQVSLNVSYSF